MEAVKRQLRPSETFTVFENGKVAASNNIYVFMYICFDMIIIFRHIEKKYM